MSSMKCAPVGLFSPLVVGLPLVSLCVWVCGRALTHTSKNITKSKQTADNISPSVFCTSLYITALQSHTTAAACRIQNEQVKSVEEIGHPKMKIMSSLTHPQSVPNLNVLVC